MQQKYANSCMKLCGCAVGDVILLLGMNIQINRLSKKVDHRFNGPHLDVKCIGPQAYCLQLSQQVGNIHDIFHV
jgi:hypothetical protein